MAKINSSGLNFFFNDNFKYSWSRIFIFPVNYFSVLSFTW